MFTKQRGGTSRNQIVRELRAEKKIKLEISAEMLAPYFMFQKPERKQYFPSQLPNEGEKTRHIQLGCQCGVWFTLKTGT